MPDVNTLEQAPRRELHIFYVLDTSGSMTGDKISALNHAMEETTEAMKTIAKNNGDAKLKIAVMEFNSGCKWMTSNGPEDLEEDFRYEYLNAGGMTDIGAALKELNSKLSRHAFLNSMTGAFMPIIIFMTDGYATDDYERPLEEIRKNRWFSHGIKIGFAIGDDPDLSMISSVVGNSEAVIKTTNLELFKKLMRFVSVTSTTRASQSSTTKNTLSGKDIVEMADVSDDDVANLPDTAYNPEPKAQIDDTDDAADGW